MIETIRLQAGSILADQFGEQEPGREPGGGYGKIEEQIETLCQAAGTAVPFVGAAFAPQQEDQIETLAPEREGAAHFQRVPGDVPVGEHRPDRAALFVVEAFGELRVDAAEIVGKEGVGVIVEGVRVSPAFKFACLVYRLGCRCRLQLCLPGLMRGFSTCRLMSHSKL